MKLLDKLFPEAAELKAAHELAERLESSFTDLNERHTTLWKNYNQLGDQLQVERTAAAAIKAKLREQTDADLLLVSARIMIATLKGEKPAAQDYALQQNLLSQQSGLRGSYQSGPYDSLLGGLGLGGIFGQH